MHDGMAGTVAQLPAMDLIVGLATLFAVVFLAAWLISPRLRAWVERPKYRFQANVRSYDKVQIGKPALEPRRPK
ncbi:MAG: hypothetical protein ABI833_15685 [Acidobacteriota bacterium]